MQNDQATNDAQAQVNDLLEQSKQIGLEIDQASQDTQAGLDQAKGEVNQTIGEIKDLTTALDEAEAESNRKLDELMQTHTSQTTQD